MLLGSFTLLGSVSITWAATSTYTSLGTFCEPTGLGSAPCAPSFTEAAGLTLDQGSGDLLVIESDPVAGNGVLERYKPNGEPDPFSALGSNEIDGEGGEDATPEGEILGYEAAAASETQVAVAPPSAGATAGYIYVTDAFSEVVDVFAPSGEYLTQLSFAYPCGVAVAPDGDVFVGDYVEEAVHKLVPAGTPAAYDEPGSPYATPTPCNVAAGAGESEGFVFATEWGGSVSKIDSEGAEEGQTKYVVDGGENSSVAVDPESGDVLTIEAEVSPVAQEYDASGPSAATQVSSLTASGNVQGIAVGGQNDYAYASVGTQVEVFGPPRPSLGTFCEPTGLGSAPCAPSFTEAAGLTLDQGSGDLLVIESDPVAGNGVLERYKPNGEPDPFSALGSNEIDGEGGEDATPEGEILGYEAAAASETQVAVAPPSAGATAGYIYVTDAFSEVVDVFAPSGEYLTQLSFAYPCGVAVAPDGDVFVGDYVEEAVHKLVPAGTPAAYDEPGSPYATPTPCNVAAGAGESEGFVFATEWGGSVSKIDSEGAEEGQTKYVVDGGENSSVAVDPESGDVLTIEAEVSPVAQEYDASGPSAATQVSSLTASGNVQGIAVGGQNDYAYASVGTQVEVFGGLVAPKYALVVRKHGGGSVTVSSDPPGISCGSACAAEFAGGKTVTLSAETAPGTVVHGWSGCDEVLGAGEDECKVELEGDREVDLTTYSRPSVSEESTSQVTASSAHLQAKVNPGGKATTYYFEYVDEDSWQANGFAGAIKAPGSPVAIPDGTSPIAVGVKVEGLRSATAYRFRAVAVNEEGTTEGERDAADDEVEHSFTTYSPPQSFGGECPRNESLRSGHSMALPDCRAWEQASLAGKNGAGVQGSIYSVRAAEDGNAVSFESAAGMPGGEGAQELALYVARRGAGGWSTTGLLPSATSGQRALVLGFTPSFDRVFDQAEPLGSGRALLERSTADGSQRDIVHYTLPSPRYRYVGSSKDGATVIFEAEPEGAEESALQLAEHAAPGKPNVYAWSQKAPDAVRLAGVLPDGTTPPLGSGAARNGQYAYDTHQVTEDGSVFFTDLETGQLYLRLNPEEPETTERDAEGDCKPDPVLACTVHISASQMTEGGGSGKHDAAGPQPARFVAASPDGSTVTLLSSEKLTNDATTGPEPEPAAIARAKASDGGEKDLSFLRTTGTTAHEIDIDEAEGYVYWTDPARGHIGRAKLDGADFTENYIPGAGNPPLEEPQGIAVIDEAAAKYIFWTERGPLDDEGKPQPGEGRVGRADLDGSNLEGECVSGLTNPRSIAVNSEFIFWSSPGLTPSDINSGAGTVSKHGLACGGVASVLAKPNRASGDIALDASHIYTSSIAAGSERSFILAYALDGASGFGSSVVFEHTKDPAPLAVDGSHLYAANRSTSEIGRANLDGTDLDLDFVKQAGHPGSIALSGGNLYWAANQEVVANAGTDLYQLDRESGQLVDLSVDGDDENGYEVQGVLGTSRDGSFVYFAANGAPDGIGNSPNEGGESAAPGDCEGSGDAATGSCNLYVAHGGEVDFIARLQAERVGGANGEAASGDAVNWVTTANELGANVQKTARVSADGSVLAFRSSRKLSGYENQGPTCARAGLAEVPGSCLEFYRFDYEEMGLGCVTCDPRGAIPTGPARLVSFEPPGIKTPPPARTLSRNLSESGNRFFFETPDALVVADTNGNGGCPLWGSRQQKQTGRILACQDVYEWEAPGEGSCRETSSAYIARNDGCIYLVSTGRSDQASFLADADLKGGNVFVFTYERLVGQDKDGSLDAYDARIDAGLAGQNPTEAAPCAGEACRGQPAAAPPAQPSGSASFSGPDSPKPHRGKKKHRKHKKHKRHRHHRGAKGKHGKKAHRAAKTKGRAGR